MYSISLYTQSNMECDGNWDLPIINLFNLMNVSPPKSWWEMFFSCRHWFQSLLGIVFNKKCGQHICNQLVLCHWRAYDIYRYWYWLFQTETPAAINRNQKIYRTPEVFISVAVSCDSPGSDHKPCNHTHSAYSQRPWCTSSPVLLKALASSTSAGDGWGRNEGAHSKFPWTFLSGL